MWCTSVLEVGIEIAVKLIDLHLDLLDRTSIYIGVDLDLSSISKDRDDVLRSFMNNALSQHMKDVVSL